ncbi:bifunctional folylpolyglutamate synthase/dihydrofolate synthase [Paracoccaceae bacterium]|nr:bifunctional folylpolyglutamate synthase/dihydrofolate synthase [Paracoccaceae bacterium]
MDQILKRLHRLHPKLIDLKLDRVTKLLKKLGHPERALPPVIHVAGTNGKGSTIAMIKAALKSFGLKTHVYTSPHLVKFNERIEIAGKRISDHKLNSLLEECEKINNSNPITFFEITTCAAFLAFAREYADYTLLEVGLGGEFDATNVVKRPLLSIITPISLDHKEYLGDSLDKIALAKAGIIKRDTPVIISKQKQRVMNLLQLHCKKMKSEVIWSSDYEKMLSRKKYFRINKNGEFLEFPFPNLEGTHQVVNATTAITALLHLNIPQKNICDGLREVYWPARLQKIEKGKLFDLIRGYNNKNELWIDGGHNEEASKSLQESMSNKDKDKFHIIYGSLKNKDYDSFLGNMSRVANTLCVVEIKNQPNSLTTEELLFSAKKFKWRRILSAVSIWDALNLVCSNKASKNSETSILICGSLYLAGEALKENMMEI